MVPCTLCTKVWVNTEISKVRSGVGKVPEGATELGGPSSAPPPAYPTSSSVSLETASSTVVYKQISMEQPGHVLYGTQRVREQQAGRAANTEGRNTQERCGPTAWGWEQGTARQRPRERLRSRTHWQHWFFFHKEGEEGLAATVGASGLQKQGQPLTTCPYALPHHS